MTGPTTSNTAMDTMCMCMSLCMCLWWWWCDGGGSDRRGVVLLLKHLLLLLLLLLLMLAVSVTPTLFLPRRAELRVACTTFNRWLSRLLRRLGLLHLLRLLCWWLCLLLLYLLLVLLLVVCAGPTNITSSHFTA